MTFCCFELDPDISKVRRLVERSNCMLRLLTVTVPLFRQDEKPLVERISEPATETVVGSLTMTALVAVVTCPFGSA